MIGVLLFSAVIAGYDWVGVSIETSKHSEEMSQRYYRSEEDCRNSTALVGDVEDRVCFPVPTLPAEVWAVQNAADSAVRKGVYETCMRNAEGGWTEAGRAEATAKCGLLPRQ